MYLSKLILNDRDRQVSRHISNVHDLHRGIMQAFPDEQREKARADWNVLFRLEPDSNILLVQSSLEPDWSRLPENYFSRKDWKPFDLDVNQFPVDRLLQFRLKANPSKRDKATGKTVGLYYQPDQVNWLHRQSERNGFKVESIDTIPTPNLWGRKKESKDSIKVHTVLFQGILKVQDPSLLVSAIQQGIGKGKSYGCGLLSLSRINRS